jgi:hypothetical protein
LRENLYRVARRLIGAPDRNRITGSCSHGLRVTGPDAGAGSVATRRDVASNAAAPDVSRWDALLHDIQTSAVMADRLVEIDGGEAIAHEGTLPTEERIEAWLADLVEVARIKILDDLGEDSFDRARRWLARKRMVATSA